MQKQGNNLATLPIKHQKGLIKCKKMTSYYLSKKSNFTGTHSVHKEGCPFLQKNDKSIFLGNYSVCNDAIWKARMIFDNSCACIFCSKEGVAMSAPAYHEWNMFSTS